MAPQKTDKKNIISFLERLWHKYKDFVENATLGSTQKGIEDIDYWREKLFTSFVTYLIPVCAIPLIPGVFISIREGQPFIATFDVFAAFSVAIVALSSKLNLIFRKAFVVFMLYCLASVLLVYLGLLGPGLIYLLALSVFITLTFPRYFAYWSVAVNLFICIGCSLIIYFKLFNSPLIKEFNLGVWIAVASNLIFLSWVSVVLISNTIGSLENTIIKEFRLKNELKKQKVTGIRHNEQLKESEGHYKSLFFLNPWPMWVLDSKTMQFLQVNEAAVQSYGYTNEEFLTMSLKDIELQNDVEVLHNKRTAKMLLSAITQHRRKNKEQFYVEIIFNSIPFQGIDATLVIARDITEQMNYIKAIEGKNEKLHEIAHIQSHYVRAPLARIMGLVGLLTRDLNEKTNPELLSYLDQSAKDLDEIIRTITSKTEQI